ncbi:MAG: twin-arginine translocase TatA/TatE family subunit [Dehalococcoidia bacterium]|jgi:sec-independent protein translocase protein TatA|nr:twin-arginine translocase TatA/TatE family subunit [Chloroflexota bacterium]MBD33072.1 twin-arginine translocase TatA/TatE family subunit [Dehalococcoidia bacterium]MQF84083.1 twin-arginine translocase TatA/TatE family subunit [SAR202 cluster bacterium]MBS17263.1 twin-arginine translocase TatA/TatE family subunit [Chloroflexota bacterium]MCH2494217.1 twin-arginine translocase TatA/TatE family subunit [Dehalococcoidia bacterium]|tara:strand:- start:9163 stop:9336 length:174 start_codon:yes stop_codon:yes gene_type:complete
MGFIQNLGPLQLVLIVVVILVLFGVGKLPQVGKGVGQAINEFKTAINKPEKKEEKED